MARDPQAFGESTRRAFLGVAAGAATASISSRTTAATADYDEVIDVVDEGADDTGSEPINSVLERLCPDGATDLLLRFPPGEYAMDEMFRLVGYRNVGFVGDDATIVPTPDFEMAAPWLFRLGVLADPGRDLRFEGFDFDFTAPDTGVRAIEAQVADGLTVRDVAVRGRHDTGTLGPALFAVTDAGGSGAVERVSLPDGGAYSANTDGDIARGPTGVLVSPYTRGTLRVRNCRIDAFPDNGLYAYTPKGRVIVEGGLYRNSNVANVRVGGDGSAVRGVRIEVDHNRPEDDNQRGIRLDGGADLTVKNVEVDLRRPNGYAISVLNGVESASIRDSEIAVGDRPNSGIVISPEAGRTLIVNTDVHFDGGNYAVAIFGDDPGEVVCQWMTISGDASGDGGRSAILCHRDSCEFRDLRVYQPGSNRRALDVHGDDCLAVFGEYMASTYPIYNTGSGTRIYDLAAASFADDEAMYLSAGTNLEIVRNTLNGGIREGDVSYAKFHGNEIT